MILCVDGRSSYMYIVLNGYLHILGEPSVQRCCTLSISASYRVFVYGRYSKSRIGFVATSSVFMRSSSTTCMLCRLEPLVPSHPTHPLSSVTYFLSDHIIYTRKTHAPHFIFAILTQSISIFPLHAFKTSHQKAASSDH